MKFQYIILSLLFLAGILFSCEEIEDPTEGLQTQPLFVQYGAGLPDTLTVTEGDFLEEYITLQAPISFETDLTATVSLTGEAASLSDLEITGDDVLEQTDEQVTVTIPFLPANGEDLVTDQTSISLRFLDDGEDDTNETVALILEGATGPNGIDLLGGRGDLRKRVVFTINNNPTVAMNFADLTLNEGFEADTTLNVDNFFADAENHPLIFSASSQYDSIATASISGDTLFINEGEYPGLTEITISASDDRGGSVSELFEVEVQ